MSSLQPSSVTASASASVIIIILLASTLGVSTAQDCAGIGNRSIQCGARNGPAKCCRNLTCPKNGDKKCVLDKDGDEKDVIDDAGDEETVPEVVAETPTAPMASDVPLLIDNDDDEDVLTPTASPEVAAGASNIAVNPAVSLSFDNIDLLRPAVDGIKSPGGISSAIFGRQSRRWDMLVDLSSDSSPYMQQQMGAYWSRSSPTLMERDPFKFTEMPSAGPSAAPTAEPSPAPSSSPSARPSSSPTDYLWVSEPLPSSEYMENDDSYFDYNPSSPRGPQSWDKVEDAPETRHWDRLQKYIDPDLEDNECGNSRSRRQSPIDVRFDKADGQCFEYHEIRHRDGEFSVSDPKVEAKILPTKLRIDYPYVVLDPDELEKMSDNERPSWTEVKYEVDEDGEKKFIAKDAVKGPSADIPKGEFAVDIVSGSRFMV